MFNYFYTFEKFADITSSQQPSTTPIQQQSSTPPIQQQSSTPPIQQQSSTTPIQQQPSTNPIQQQPSNNNLIDINGKGSIKLDGKISANEFIQTNYNSTDALVKFMYPKNIYPVENKIGINQPNPSAALDVNGNVNVSGNSIFNNVNVNGKFITKNVDIEGDSKFNNMNVNGNFMGNNMNIQGNSKFNNMNVNGNFMGKNIDIQGDSKFNNMNISGNAIFNGDLTTSKSVNALKFKANGTVESSGLIFDSNTPVHINRDGALYRHNGNVFLTVDDNFYIRKFDASNTNTPVFNFDTKNKTLNIKGSSKVANFEGETNPYIALGNIGQENNRKWYMQNLNGNNDSSSLCFGVLGEKECKTQLNRDGDVLINGDFIKNKDGFFRIFAKSSDAVQPVPQNILLNNFSDDFGVLASMNLNNKPNVTIEVYFNILLTNKNIVVKEVKFSIVAKGGIYFEYVNNDYINSSIFNDSQWKDHTTDGEYTYTIPNNSMNKIIKCKLSFFQSKSNTGVFRIKNLKSAISSIGRLV